MTTELNDEERGELEHLLTAGLMRKATPTHLEESLVEKGIVRRGIGGLVVTDLGHQTYHRRKK